MKINSLSISLLMILLVSACASPAIESTSTPEPPTVTLAPTPTPEPSATPIPPTATIAPTPTPDLPLTLTSTAFEDGGEIPAQYFYKLGSQCNGDNLSPQLAWSGVPAEAQSLAITSIDPDGGNWVHWVQFNIPPDVSELPEAPGGPDIGVKGKNHFNINGYGGPCPPSGSHRYVFTLYALDTLLSLEEGATYASLQIQLKDHILKEVQLIGLGSRQP